MMIDRRAFLGSTLALATTGPAFAATDLQARIDRAARLRRPLVLPAGRILTGPLELPDGLELAADPAGTTLVFTRTDAPGLIARGAGRIALRGLAFEGPGAGGPASRHGLLETEGVARIEIESCLFRNFPGDGLRLNRCGGRVGNTTIAQMGRAALFSLDSLGLEITGNSVRACADNGIQIWRSVQGADGSRLTANRIADIANRSGGTGQYGNGISIFRAGSIAAQKNVISRCAFSALRNNSGHGVSFQDNTCLDSGETAIFAEFAFRDAVIERNVIDGAVSGIQAVNFADHGGRGARIESNTIRNLVPTPAWLKQGRGHQWGYEVAIKAEAETRVSGNRIEGAPWIGIMAGWGASLKDVHVEDNDIGPAVVGVAVSVAPGAGAAAVRRNRIAGARDAAIAGMRWNEIAARDLAADGARYPAIRVEGNRVA